jgi:hypothetical protein
MTATTKLPNSEHSQASDDVESCTEAVQVVVKGLLNELAAVPDCLMRGNALNAALILEKVFRRSRLCGGLGSLFVDETGGR